MAKDSAPDAVAGEEQFIDCKCPWCGHNLSIRATLAGLVEECFNCLEAVIVPADGSAVGRRLPLPLETPTLILRRFTPDDMRDLVEVVAEPESLPDEREGGQEEERITIWIRDDAKAKFTQPNQALALGIVLRKTNKLIGYASFWFIDSERQQGERRQGGLNIIINPLFRRQGHATEAVRALLVFCFAGIGLHRVITWCRRLDEAPRRLIEKSGFRLEGEFLEDRQENGRWVDSLYYAMLEREYAAAKSSAA
jgi:RimJ/RimL family protein N-acetyltransferase